MYKGGFGGFGGGNQMQNLMRQAQKMQEDMARAKKELEESEFVSSVGGGMVEVRMTGDRKMKSIAIKPEVVDPDDVEMLEDLIIAAINDASAKAEELSKDKMGPMGGLGGLM